MYNEFNFDYSYEMMVENTASNIWDIPFSELSDLMADWINSNNSL